MEVEVRFVRHGGLPVTYVSDDVDASAIRVVDLQKKYYISAWQLAERLGLTRSRSTALRRHIGADANEDMAHVFNFESQKITRYSDNAFVKMRDALSAVNMDNIWSSHGAVARKNAPPPCAEPGCVGPAFIVAA